MRKLTLILFIFFFGLFFLKYKKIFNKTNNFLNKKTIQIKLKNTNYLQKDYICKSLYIKNGDNFGYLVEKNLRMIQTKYQKFKVIVLNQKKTYTFDFN